MGCEDFQVIIRSTADRAEVKRLLLRNPHVREDPDGGPLKADGYLLYDDGRHLIEMEVGSHGQDMVGLSMRFALCHPPTIDSVFLGLASAVVSALGAEVSIMEDIPAGVRGDFPPGDLNGFPEAIAGSIASKRALWVAEFGEEQATHRCEEAIMRFVAKT